MKSVRYPFRWFGKVEELRNHFLTLSFNSYEGKNPLVVALKDAKQNSFQALSSRRGVCKATFEEIRLRMRSTKITAEPSKIEVPEDEDIEAEQLSEAEMDTIRKLQLRWLKLQPKIVLHRT